MSCHLKIIAPALMALALTACGGASVDGSSSGATDAPQATASKPEVIFTGARFEQTLEAAKAKIAAKIDAPLVIPVPKDPGGGYTHEKHKENAKLIYDAGALYQLTGERKYADYAAKLMSGYADLYPNWGQHPAPKEQSPGRMFWQNLNESWWLVHVSQGYGAVLDTLSEEQREHIETNLLRQIADFLSEGSPETFDKIHNHGTWATAAVGMTGYVIGDKEYSDKALLGLDKSGKAGFLKQMDHLFSPDGYYNEGPYYQRYALMPFVLFGQAIQANEPERKIFEHRDGILKKAIYSTIQQNYNGLFFPINDAIKDKGIATAELLYGVSIAYDLTGDKELLSVAAEQGKYVLTPESRAVSEALVAGEDKPFNYRSMRLSDGKDGTQGALDVLRASKDPKGVAVVAKNTSQGLGHGHFDKMGLIVYDEGYEVLRDYGAARFLNIEAKFGGHYLYENNAYAKHTVAHNALVVDEISHFDNNLELANQHAPKLGAFRVSDNLSATSAHINTAYDDVGLSRSVAVIKDAAFENPIIVDITKAASDGVHTYDLPFHYNGHLVETNFKVQANPLSRSPLGHKNGYEYLWKVAEATPLNGLSQVTWLLDRRFYSVTSSMPEASSVIFTELGANDPNFNLRREAGFILRAKTADGVSYASVIEPHGEYNPTVEYTLGSHSQVKTVSHVSADTADYVRIETKDGQIIGLGMSANPDAEITHSVDVDGQAVSWQGPYHLFHSDVHKEGETGG